METIEKYYSMIANKANEIVPVEWNRIFLYFEIVPGVVSLNLYFYEKNQNSLVKLQDIAIKYKIDEMIIKKLQFELVKIIREFYKKSLNLFPNIWTTMTFVLESNGKFKIDYGYEDLNETIEVNRRKEWESKYLNV